MLIHIYVHSLTGNTLSVAETLKVQLSSHGHKAELFRITSLIPEAASGKPRQAGGPPQTLANTRIEPLPGAGPADLILIGTPIHGFSAPVETLKAIAEIGSLSGKTAVTFVTGYLNRDWMGGNRALRQMKNALEARGASVAAQQIIHWRRRDREEKIKELIDQARAVRDELA